MKKILSNLGKKLGDAAINLTENRYGKSSIFFAYEPKMPEILKKDLKIKKNEPKMPE